MWRSSRTFYPNNHQDKEYSVAKEFRLNDSAGKDADLLITPILAHGIKESKPNDRTSQKYVGVRVRLPVKEMLNKIRSAKTGSSNVSKKEFDSPKLRETMDELLEVLDNKLLQSTETSLAAHPTDNLCLPCHMDNENSHTTFEEQSHRHNKSSYNSFFDHHNKCHLAELQSSSHEFSQLNSKETFNFNNNIGTSYINLNGTAGSVSCSTKYTVKSHQCWVENPPMIHGCCENLDMVTIRQQKQTSFSFFEFQIMHEEEKLCNPSIDKGITTLDEDESRLLFSAISDGKRAQAYVLARRLTMCNKINVKDSNKRTALHVAAEKNQHLIFQDLLGFGANINERDSNGKSPLHICASYGHVNVMEVLKNTKETGQDLQVEALDSSGLTPLHYAVLAHNFTVKEYENRHLKKDVKKCLHYRKGGLLQGVKCLLQMGADPLTRELKTGQTSIQLAHSEDNKEMVSFFSNLYPNMKEMLNEV
ncbi:NF-kappa-B inhibitor zeta-like [Pelobates cultripes]|uniref:NF-kappa-B inhibitor zeta-like n=1 Tax=Pelobates cultripes TaxID=61616 RepID=A0AAD1T6T1_PELCU|nr:NF-kappa-B inhibitor zeta-like [Pelobates cultripes]